MNFNVFLFFSDKTLIKTFEDTKKDVALKAMRAQIAEMAKVINYISSSSTRGLGRGSRGGRGGGQGGRGGGSGAFPVFVATLTPKPAKESVPTSNLQTQGKTQAQIQVLVQVH